MNTLVCSLRFICWAFFGVQIPLGGLPRPGEPSLDGPKPHTFQTHPRATSKSKTFKSTDKIMPLRFKLTILQWGRFKNKNNNNKVMCRPRVTMYSRVKNQIVQFPLKFSRAFYVLVSVKGVVKAWKIGILYEVGQVISWQSATIPVYL